MKVSHCSCLILKCDVMVLQFSLVSCQCLLLCVPPILTPFRLGGVALPISSFGQRTCWQSTHLLLIIPIRLVTTAAELWSSLARVAPAVTVSLLPGADLPWSLPVSLGPCWASVFMSERQRGVQVWSCKWLALWRQEFGRVSLLWILWSSCSLHHCI